MVPRRWGWIGPGAKPAVAWTAKLNMAWLREGHTRVGSQSRTQEVDFRSHRVATL